jgi:hypothetical protein
VAAGVEVGGGSGLFTGVTGGLKTGGGGGVLT